jgi:hypothetical protein
MTGTITKSDKREELIIMSQHQRRHRQERQPLLPWNAVRREINRRDMLRETQSPQQLELFPTLQHELFGHQEDPAAPPKQCKPEKKRPKLKKRTQKPNDGALSSNQLDLRLY